MKFRNLLLSFAALALVACSGSDSSGSAAGSDENAIVDYEVSKEAGSDQFDFAGNYTAPELTIDGYDDDEQWANATTEITYGATNSATFKMYRGEEALFCYWEVSDPDLQTVGTNNGDDVCSGDSVEVYFDFKNDAADSPTSDDVQINIGAHGKTRILIGNSGSWGNWNGLLDYEIALDGTLNDNSDIDVGYSVELMIPYAQASDITKDSVFGFSVGHVQRGTDSTNTTLAYTWGGLTYEGDFVDPQKPSSYIVCVGNQYYSRDNVPMDTISLSGSVVDQEGTPVEGASIAIGGVTGTTDSDGEYSFDGIDPNSNQTVTISKDGYKTYETTITSTTLRGFTSGSGTQNFLLEDASKTVNVTFSGIVSNPAEGVMEGASVTCGSNETSSSSNGSFSIQGTIQNDLSLIISKEGYKDSEYDIDPLELIGSTTKDLGTVPLYSPSSTFSFGGARGITAITAEVYRDFESINFLFSMSEAVTNGSHIELFIDTGSSLTGGRDTSDYRLDFDSDGNISITNFGDGSNTSVSSSGIGNNPYLSGTTYYIEASVPYSFLGVESDEIIGISAGSWSESLSDWDGWAFPDINGVFADYVAPEYTAQYTRIGLDNGLYRAENNTTYATKIYGYITNSETDKPVSGVTVGNFTSQEDGYYAVWALKNTAVSVSFSLSGYITQTFSFTASNLSSDDYRLDIDFVESLATISGTCNVDGASVTCTERPDYSTTVSDGSYTIKVPTTSNAHLVFSAEGYKDFTVVIGAAALVSSANSGTPITRNVTMTASA